MPDQTPQNASGPSSRTRSKLAAELHRRQHLLSTTALKPFGTLTTLPAELLLSIFTPANLDVPSLFHFRLANTHCKTLIDHTIPEYAWLSTTHPIVIRALVAAGATTPSCRTVVDQLRGKGCTLCNDRALPERDIEPRHRGRRKFWSVFYLPTAELICRACYRRCTTPGPRMNGPDGEPLWPDLIPWSLGHLRGRLRDGGVGREEVTEERLRGMGIPCVKALPYVKDTASPMQTEGLVLCDARAVERVFRLERPLWLSYPRERTQEWTEVIEQNRAVLECYQDHEGAPLVIDAPYPLLHSSGKKYARVDVKWHQNLPRPALPPNWH
ncbi:hypothetical protein B0T16DRAFT_507972 [Cercophora newfieldiana]|uniref:F-box domain-containing protein n=1 Tax=Cercophora newfieldiana TaxID=92897 RepID=A0AA40CS12_9PEZI|nr:hypothetical protein B0T16DRAFT_507972 [Cercophora newfieldiana]